MLAQGVTFAILIGLTIFLFLSKKSDVASLLTIFIFEVIIIGTFWTYHRASFVFTGGGIPPVTLSKDQILIVSDLFIKATAFLILGNILGTFFVGKHTSYPSAINPKDIKLSTRTLGHLSRIISLITFLFIIGNLRLLISRDSYLFAARGSVNGAIRYLLPVFGLLALYLVSQGILRILNSCTFSLVLIIEFSASSRSLGILLVCLGTFWGLNAKSKFLGYIRFIFCAILGSAAISLVLQLRGQPKNGLFPNIRFLEGSSFLNFNLTTVFSTLLVIIPVTAIGVSVSTPDTYFLTSFNPLPGSMTDWYSIAPNLNINPWTPTGGVAQVHNLGGTKEAITWILIGITTQILSRLSIKSRIPQVSTMVLLILNLSASLQYLQYSIRAGFRFIYADIAFLILLRYIKVRISK